MYVKLISLRLGHSHGEDVCSLKYTIIHQVMNRYCETKYHIQTFVLFFFGVSPSPLSLLRLFFFSATAGTVSIVSFVMMGAGGATPPGPGVSKPMVLLRNLSRWVGCTRFGGAAVSTSGSRPVDRKDGLAEEDSAAGSAVIDWSGSNIKCRVIDFGAG
jgi:hypothetical protein